MVLGNFSPLFTIFLSQNAWGIEERISIVKRFPKPSTQPFVTDLLLAPQAEATAFS